MKLRIGRILFAAPVATLLAAVLITISGPLIYRAFGPPATTPYMLGEIQRLTLWSAPLAGFVVCVFGARWAARGLRDHSQANGLSFGIAVALLDLMILYLSGASFGLLMLGSALGRVAGGYLGGSWAGRKAMRRSSLASSQLRIREAP